MKTLTNPRLSFKSSPNYRAERGKSIFKRKLIGAERVQLHYQDKNNCIYTLSDLGVLSNLIGSLSLANEHYSPPTE